MSGATTDQMLHAPQGAIFVVPGHLRYFQLLALHLNRPDLGIRVATLPTVNRLRGHDLPVVVDHAVDAMADRDLVDQLSDVLEARRGRMTA